MSKAIIERLKEIKDFDGLIVYLKDELGWPIEEEKVEDLTFEYDSKELGIEEKYAANINIIKQIRPLVDNQPWGLFYVEFESKYLPVVVLRRILRGLIHNRRNSSDHMKTWELSDLIFLSTLGEKFERKISFAHFSESKEGLPLLRTFSWDPTDTYFHYLQTRLDLDKLRWPDDENDIESWRERWSSAFKLKHREVIRTSKQLASIMAHLAKQIREQVKYVYKFEIKDGPLHKLFMNFKNILIHDLKIDNFADMYAQTISYGLFSARASHEREFKIDNISAMIPNTNPFLKNLFEECTKIGEDNIDKIDLDELGVRELILLLKESNIEAILQDFGKQKKGEDPIIHFYELFLKEYDTDQKIKRGVFYTPDPVVSFIVRSVDKIIQSEFGYTDGLMDFTKTPKNYNIRILDPAAGTGTFLQHTIREIKKKFDKKYEDLKKSELLEKWNKFVPEHIFPKICGFEIMMAPYAVAHLKLGLTLKETGYDFKSNKRLGIYLTNTLEGTHTGAGTMDTYLNWLANEGSSANKIKTDNSINILIGNPPYSGHSANNSKWIHDLMRGNAIDDKYNRNYFNVDGESLNERNPKWVNDDYVKFIRFGQWKLDKTKQGILAFITNHNYLDTATFRGMRQELLESFNSIYIVNLHGNIRRKEMCPDGTKDENVFDIQQGVCISFFIKTPTKKGKSNVYVSNLWGLREKKYEFLNNNNILTLKWKKINPFSPWYMFQDLDMDKWNDYKSGWKIIDIFPINSIGIVTARDKFTIKFTPNEVWETINDFVKIPPEIARKKYKLTKDARDWKISLAQKDLIESGIDKSKIIKILYRPFDFRYTYYTGNSRGFHCMPRAKVMTNLIESNLALITRRQMLPNRPCNYFFVSDSITSDGVIRSDNKGGESVYPLYIYSNNKDKKPNLNEDFLNFISNRYKKKITPEKIFYYIYAIFYSINYREVYAEFLRFDYPRIPFTEDFEVFTKLSNLGKTLVDIHTMKKELPTGVTFEIAGLNIIESIKYIDMKVYINTEQYFDNVSSAVWNFYIGGYQVLKKWLKGKSGKTLTNLEIDQFKLIAATIQETLDIMKKIDDVDLIH